MNCEIKMEAKIGARDSKAWIKKSEITPWNYEVLDHDLCWDNEPDLVTPWNYEIIDENCKEESENLNFEGFNDKNETKRENKLNADCKNNIKICKDFDQNNLLKSKETEHHDFLTFNDKNGSKEVLESNDKSRDDIETFEYLDETFDQDPVLCKETKVSCTKEVYNSMEDIHLEELNSDSLNEVQKNEVSYESHDQDPFYTKEETENTEIDVFNNSSECKEELNHACKNNMKEENKKEENSSTEANLNFCLQCPHLSKIHFSKNDLLAHINLVHSDENNVSIIEEKTVINKQEPPKLSEMFKDENSPISRLR